MKAHSTVAILFVTCCTFLTVSGLAQQPQEPNSAQQVSLRTFLQAYLSDVPADQRNAVRYSAAFIDLNGDGSKEVIVYLSGRSWCGSGGCTMLVLTPNGSSYRVVTETTITWPPVRVLRSKTNGWHDISVWIQGGGIQPGYEAELSFDGTTYPSNPSVPPAKRLGSKMAGQVVVPKTEVGSPVY
jgi:hypothetical protein